MGSCELFAYDKRCVLSTGHAVAKEGIWFLFGKAQLLATGQHVVVLARDESKVVAENGAIVYALGCATVSLDNQSFCEARGNVSVSVRGLSKLVLREHSVAKCYGAKTIAYDNSSVEADEHSNVIVHNSAKVRSSGQVLSFDNSTVEAYGNANVSLNNKSTCVAFDNANVMARDYSVVEARDAVKCQAYDFARVIKRSEGVSLELHDFAALETLDI